MELRTYVTLEETLTARLVKDWKAQSDPIYRKIAAACKDQKWDEARRLVPELDMTEVGTKRKEWIRYLLQSFAMYGATRAGEEKPLLTGTPAADTVLEQATNQILMYLTNAATTQVQQQALQLIARDEASHTVQKSEYSYGIVMTYISPDSEMGNYLAIARALIADADLMAKGKDVGGDHVTVRYGITGGYEEIREYLRRQPTFGMMLGKVRIFEPSESSDGAAVVVVDVESRDLHRMNEELSQVGNWKASSFPQYLPHVTLAYIRPEAMEKYQKLAEYGVLAVEGVQYFNTFLTLSNPDGDPEQVLLEGGSSRHFRPVSDVLVRKADASGRFVTPFVSFDNQGSDQLQLIASLNGSRLATWGFTAEAELRGIRKYKINPLLDGRVCPFCRIVSNHEFDTSDARHKVVQALQVQDPEDLKTVQPWPVQNEDLLKNVQEFSAQDFTARGWHIPPYHPGCRCICVGTGTETVRAKKPVVPPEQQTIPVQAVTPDTLQELGITASQKEVDHWNRYLSLNPVGVLSKLSGMTPQEILEGKLGRGAIQFLRNGDIGIKTRGVMDGVKYATSTVLDPYTGTYYLTQADFQAGDAQAASRFLARLFTALVDIGTSAAAKELVVSVAVGEAPGYVQLGFVPTQKDWDAIRQSALSEMEGGTLQEMGASLSAEDRLLIQHLLENKDPNSVIALMDLDLSFEGETVGQRILKEAQGEFRLDLDNPAVVNYLKESFAA